MNKVATERASRKAATNGKARAKKRAVAKKTAAQLLEERFDKIGFRFPGPKPADTTSAAWVELFTRLADLGQWLYEESQKSKCPYMAAVGMAVWDAPEATRGNGMEVQDGA